MDAASSGIKRDHPACHQRAVPKPASVMVWGCISAQGLGSLHTWEGTINAEWSNTCCHPDCVFFTEDFVCFNKTMSSHILRFTPAWLRGGRVRLLHWFACSPDLSPTMKWKIWQRKLQTVEQLNAYIRPEWDNVSLLKPQHLLSSVPKHLQRVVKRWGDVTPWQTCPCPNVFERCCWYQIQIKEYISYICHKTNICF